MGLVRGVGNHEKEQVDLTIVWAKFQPAIFFRIFSTEPLVCPPILNFKPHKPPKMSEPRTSKFSFYILVVAFVEYYEPLDSLLLL